MAQNYLEDLITIQNRVCILLASVRIAQTPCDIHGLVLASYCSTHVKLQLVVLYSQCSIVKIILVPEV